LGVVDVEEEAGDDLTDCGVVEVHVVGDDVVLS